MGLLSGCNKYPLTDLSILQLYFFFLFCIKAKRPKDMRVLQEYTLINLMLSELYKLLVISSKSFANLNFNDSL